MTQLPNSPDDRRNRKGCFVILGILAVFVILYLYVSLNAQPGNSIWEDIQTLPTAKR